MTKCSLLVLLLLRTAALWAVEIPHFDDNKTQTYTIGVPKSQIALEPLRYVPPPPVELGLSASSWSPTDFERGSYKGGASRFQKADLPAASINRYEELAQLGYGLKLSSVLGLGYFSLNRTGTSTIQGIKSGTGSENLNLIMGRAGLDLTWPGILRWGLEPVLGAALVPTYGLATSSIFEDDVSVFGIPVEADVGMIWRPKLSLFGSRGSVSFALKGEAVSGRVGGSSLNGLGAAGEVRISL